MTFTYDDADLSKTIACFWNDGNRFNIFYLDDSKSTYISYSEDEKEKIQNIMINQAKDRQKAYDIMKLNGKNKLNLLLVFLLSFFTVVETINEKKLNLPEILQIIIVGGFTNSYLINRTQLKELKKYKMFLEIIDKLDEINSDCGEKCLPLEINTIDEFSYSEIKSYYKQYRQK